MREVTLIVDGGDGCDARRLDTLTRQLHDDLRLLGRVRVGQPPATPPEGAKTGTAAEIGTLVLSGLLSASTIRAISNVIIAYIRRTGARSVAWQANGREYTFTGLSATDQHDLVQALIETQAHRDGE